MSEPDRKAPWIRRRRITLRTVLIGSLLLVVVMGLLALHVVGRYRVNAALERIRAAGDPVLPEDIVFEPVGPGEDPTAWLAEAGEIELPWDVDCLMDPYMFEELLDLARAGGFTAEHAAGLEELNVCYGSPDDAGNFWDDLWDVLTDPEPDSALSDCQLTALRVAALGGEPIAALGLDACRMARLDCELAVQEYMSSAGCFPDYRSLGLIPLLDGLDWATALHEIAEGREESGIDRIRASLCLAGLAEGLPSIIDFDFYQFSTSVALGGLRTALSYLSPGRDLGAIEELVRRADARGTLLWALRCDRAIGNHRFARFHRLGEGELRESLDCATWLDRIVFAVALPFDHAQTLDDFEKAIFFTRTPYWKVSTPLAQWREDRDRPYSCLVNPGMPTPPSPRAIELATELDARLRIAQVALFAYREGIDAAIDLAASTTDPFSGRPLRTRVEPGGVIRIWSIGLDCVDDGGALHPREDEYSSPDVTWKIRLR